MIKKVVFLLCLFALTACATSSQLVSKSTLIDPGATKADVTSIMGPPQDRQFNGKDEAWQYCTTGFSTDNYVVVWFNNGYVTGVQTYKNSGTGFCHTFFRTVNWQDAPDRTYEFRVR